MASGRLAIWMWLQVEPPFCARPAASWVITPLPSRWAAMPSSEPMVITPVPPTPATTMPQACSARSEEHTSELQSQSNIVCRLLLEKKNEHSHRLIQRSSVCLVRPPVEDQ